MKNLRVLQKFEYDPIHSFRNTNPFTIMFCYPKTSPPFILKGGLNDVEQALKKFNEPMFVHYTYWYHKNHRGGYSFHNLRGRLWLTDSRDKEKKRKMWVLTNKGIKVKEMRRVPRKWMRELDTFI